MTCYVSGRLSGGNVWSRLKKERKRGRETMWTITRKIWFSLYAVCGGTSGQRVREGAKEREEKSWIEFNNTFLYITSTWNLGSSDSTWKQGEWVFKPKSDTDHTVQIKHHDDVDSAKRNEFRTDASTSNLTNNSIPDAISQCWPKDWLPIDFPNARICAMNYDTGENRPNNFKSINKSNKFQCIPNFIRSNPFINCRSIFVASSVVYIEKAIQSGHACNENDTHFSRSQYWC